MDVELDVGMVRIAVHVRILNDLLALRDITLALIIVNDGVSLFTRHN
jgi:hypothetical protein